MKVIDTRWYSQELSSFSTVLSRKLSEESAAKNIDFMASLCEALVDKNIFTVDEIQSLLSDAGITSLNVRFPVDYSNDISDALYKELERIGAHDWGHGGLTVVNLNDCVAVEGCKGGHVKKRNYYILQDTIDKLKELPDHHVEGCDLTDWQWQEVWEAIEPTD